jgi:predicted oxidoreductase
MKKECGVSNFKNLTFNMLAKHFDVPITIAAMTLGVNYFSHSNHVQGE